MLSSDWENGKTIVVKPVVISECAGENCSKFIEWYDVLFDQVGEHTAREAGHGMADKCAKVVGCFFEQTIEIEGVQNAT